MMPCKLLRPLFAAFFLSLAVLPAQAAASPAAIACRWQVSAPGKAGEPIWLRFSLHNQSRQVQWVLTWNTPLEGWFGRYLKVEGPQGEVPYQGPMVKRGAPDTGDYRRLPIGGSAHAKLDLRQVYELSAPGEYRLSFVGTLHDVVSGRKPKPSRQERVSQNLDCPGLSFTVE